MAESIHVGNASAEEGQPVMTHITALNILQTIKSDTFSFQHLASHTTPTKHGHRQSEQ